jgi:hypothetical protein
MSNLPPGFDPNWPAEPLPGPGEMAGCARGGVFYNVVVDRFGASNIFALPSDNDVGLQPGPPPFNTRHSFIVPRLTVLNSVHIKGDAVNLASVNTVADAFANPFRANVNLYINGIFVQTLVAIPAGQATFDVYAVPNVRVKPGDLIWFVVDLSAWASGEMGNFLANFGFA